MLRITDRALFVFFAMFILSSNLAAQEVEAQGMPPAKVVVSKVNSGIIAPEAEFIGSIFYPEVSDVASEVSGSVEVVQFEEGQRVKGGDVLTKLNSDLLKKTLQATKANHQQVLSDLEKAEIDFKRVSNLYREESIAERIYNDHRFRVKGLRKKAASLKAEVERHELELQKKTIKAPFNGVVIKRQVDKGEWVSAGATVATIARDDVLDVLVEVPERIMKYVKQGMVVRLKAGGKRIKGKVLAIIPRGDISTRTFPVKVRIKNTRSLIEGMEAGVSLPVGERIKTFIMSRDAVITMFGMTVIFAVVDSKVRMIPVRVVGYKNIMAGVTGKGLHEGMKVVVKGNERLRDGQAVNIIKD